MPRSAPPRSDDDSPEDSPTEDSPTFSGADAGGCSCGGSGACAGKGAGNAASGAAPEDHAGAGPCASGACGKGGGASSDPRPPHPVDFAVEWRGYQEAAIAALLRHAHGGATRLHLVAPPGSGKTLMGLYVAMALGRPVVVLSHTRAIASQWLESFRQQALDLEGAFAGDVASRAVGEPPQADAPLPLLVSMTYQAFARQRPERLRRGAAVSELLAPTVLAWQERWGRAGALLVLDECHHLTAFWAEVLLALLERHPGCVVLGLTATPPEDAPPEEQRRFRAVVGDVTHEIPLVGAVREGALAPFQDLALFVRPEADADALIAGADGALARWVEAAVDGIDVSVVSDGAGPPGWLPGLRAHALARLTVEPGRRQRREPDVLTLSDREPDFVLALARALRAFGVELPADVIPCAAMERDLGRDDLFALLDDYVACVLSPAAEDLAAPALAAAAGARLRLLEQALAPLGMRAGAQGLRGGDDGGAIAATLAASRSRLVGMVHILRRELGWLGTSMCAAVICDFVRTAAGGHGGRQADDSSYVPGAIGAFRAIAADPELAPLLPMLATGEHKWLPAQLAPLLRDRLGPLGPALRLQALDPADIGTTAGAWVAAALPDHDGELLRALTSLLEHDHAHCIVGTRVLLGEGWDCRALDTLVDLTAARSHVAVNQLRGRALRLQSDRPEKIAHLWDVVAVPAVTGASGIGLEDLRRFVHKHERFHAPALDGALERGAGHVLPLLRGTAEQIASRLEEAGPALWQLASERPAARARWRLGEPVSADERVELRQRAAAPLPTPMAARARALGATRLTGPRASLWSLRWQQRQRWHRRLLGLAALAGVAALGAAWSHAPLVGAAGLGLLAGAAAALWALDRRLRGWQPMAPGVVEGLVVDAAIAAASAGSGKLAQVQVVGERAGAGSWTWTLRGGDAAARARMALALDQALHGCPAPHYLLELQARAPTPAWWRAPAGEAWVEGGAYPIPAALGTSRKAAEAFAAAWRRTLGPCRLRAHRSTRVHEDIPAPTAAPTTWLRPAQGTLEVRQVLVSEPSPPPPRGQAR